MSEWISVEDRLPDEYQVVLFIWNVWKIGSGVIIHGGYHSYDGFQPSYKLDKLCGFDTLAGALQKYVTHWMPLPELPDQPEEIKD